MVIYRIVVLVNNLSPLPLCTPSVASTNATFKRATAVLCSRLCIGNGDILLSIFS